ncbi:NnrS family protein [Pseudophaeobacter sp.]|uniref:NnrS family protein n=1 Tax=Pseudophaeobacter sp. TaxID=1971739 RepID=UPI00329859F6
MTARPTFAGPALFSYGFRPFFAAACIFGFLVVPLWVLIWRGSLEYQGHFGAVDWHIHEMIFGYGSAVLAGFLFTAVPNWTGRMPVRGLPLAVLFAVWILGRLALWGGLVAPGLAFVVECSFLLLVAAMIAREIIAGKNWRNLKVLVPVLLLGAGNILFHLEVILSGASDYGRRFGIALLVFLIMLIGGRIIPSFTRNWLAKERGQDGPMPIPFSRFDAVALAFGVAGLVGWTLAPESVISAVLLLLAGVLHIARLTRWQGQAVLRSPLLVMLHVAYIFIPLGLMVSGFAALGLVEQVAAVHLLGIGAIGGMTVAVMMRATLGHTGRALVAGPVLTLGFGLLLAAAVARIGSGILADLGLDGVLLSAGFWTVSFAVLCLRMLPWLVLPKAARRKPNPAPQQAVNPSPKVAG